MPMICRTSTIYKLTSESICLVTYMIQYLPFHRYQFPTMCFFKTSTPLYSSFVTWFRYKEGSSRLTVRAFLIPTIRSLNEYVGIQLRFLTFSQVFKWDFIGSPETGYCKLSRCMLFTMSRHPRADILHCQTGLKCALGERFFWKTWISVGKISDSHSWKYLEIVLRKFVILFWVFCLQFEVLISVQSDNSKMNVHI